MPNVIWHWYNWTMYPNLIFELRWIEVCCARSRYQGQRQVITAHNICEMWLLLPVFDAWFWHRNPELTVIVGDTAKLSQLLTLADMPYQAVFFKLSIYQCISATYTQWDTRFWTSAQQASSLWIWPDGTPVNNSPLPMSSSSMYLYMNPSTPSPYSASNGSTLLHPRCQASKYYILLHPRCQASKYLHNSISEMNISLPKTMICPTSTNHTVNKYSLLMHCIKIKSPAIFLEWAICFNGWIYFYSIDVPSGNSKEA